MILHYKELMMNRWLLSGEVSRDLLGLASAAELVRKVLLARIGPGQGADQPPTRHSPPRHHRTCRRFPLRVGGLGGAIGFLRTHHNKGTALTRNAPTWDSTVGLCLWSWGAPLPPTADPWGLLVSSKPRQPSRRGWRPRVD